MIQIWTIFYLPSIWSVKKFIPQNLLLLFDLGFCTFCKNVQKTFCKNIQKNVKRKNVKVWKKQLLKQYFIRSKFKQSKQSGWCLAFFTYPLTIISGSKFFFCSFFTSPKHLCWKKYTCIRTDFIWRFATSDKATMRTTFTLGCCCCGYKKKVKTKAPKKS